MPQLSGARERVPSRRALLKGATSFALPVPCTASAGAPDPAQVVGEQWCALEAEQRRLYLDWQKVETWLFEHRNWPKLTQAERAATPEAAPLWAIEDRLDQIDKLHDQLVPQLKKTRATTREGLFARFEALAWFVPQDEHPDAASLLKSCLADLRRLWV